MSNLTDYIEKTKKYILENKLNEIETIRYVYLDLGKRFSFDLDYAFGNRKTKKEIYNSGKSEEELDKNMNENTIICKSLSYILEHVLSELGVNIKTVTDGNDFRLFAHVYNIVTPKDGEEYIVDLQDDLENIQAHSCTKRFGLSVKEGGEYVIQRFELEKIDKKLGYIDNEHYYSDDYLYLLKSDIGYFTDFAEKVEFILSNIDIHENKNIQYAERKWHHEDILKELFSKKELNKIHMIDCFKNVNREKDYKECIIVEKSRGYDAYLYSTEELMYKKLSMEEFAKEVQNGLVNLQGVPGLRRELDKLKKENKKKLKDERENVEK